MINTPRAYSATIQLTAVCHREVATTSGAAAGGDTGGAMDDGTGGGESNPAFGLSARRGTVAMGTVSCSVAGSATGAFSLETAASGEETSTTANVTGNAASPAMRAAAWRE